MSKDIRELEQTLASNPRDVNAFEALEERLLQTRRWQELLRLYLDRADLQEKISRYWDRALQNLEKLSAELEEVPDRAEVMVGIGQIWEEQLKRRDQAMVYYQRAFKVWPYKTRALDLARNIYAQQNNWKLVVRLYELQLQVAREPRDQAQIYRDIARIQDQHLGDLNAAAKLRQKADDLYPEPIADPVTTPFARPDEREPVTAPIPAVVVEAAPVELPPAEEVTVEVSAVVAEVAPEVAAPEVAAPEVEAPVVAAPEVEAPVVAAPEVEAATVLGISPVTRAALEADEEEAAPAEDAVSLARTTRMPNVVRDSNWEERLQRTRGELARARGVSASTLHVKVARTLLDHSPEDGDIEPSLRRALEADGHNVEARNLLLGLLRSQERWEEVGAVLEQKASDTSSRREDVRAALIELAELQRGVFGDEAAAAATFEKVLALDPSHPDALAFARAYHEGKQDWAALVDLYENALRLKRRTPEEMDLLLELGELLWRKVGDMQAAERQFRRVRLADARSLEMLRFYEAFYKAEGDWKKYYATLSSLRQQIEDEREALALCYEMARVASQEMGAPEKAIDVWKSVLKIDPRDAQARQALHDLYIEAKKWNALLEHYKEEIALLEGEPSSEGAQVDLYLKIVEIYRDRLRLEVMVINTYNAILQLDPTHAEAIEALASRYEQGRRWNDLIGILQKKAEVLMGSAPSASLPVLHRIAELWQKSLGNAAQAIPTLEQILSLDARDKVAIDALKELYQQRRDWGALLQVLEKEAALLEGEGLAVHLAEMARIAHQRQSDPSSARALYERLCGALEGEVIASPRLYREALKELEGIYEDQRDEAALARVLERRLRVTEGDAQRIDTLERLASLAYGGLGSPERAVSLWGQILELDRDHEGALTRLTDHYVQERRWESLEALFGARGDWARLFEILDSGAAVVEDEGEQAALYRRMTRVAREELRDNDKLILSLESLQGLWPRDPEVARALLPCYRAAKEPAKEVQANQVLLETEGGDAFALTCEIARLYEESLGDKAQAFDWLDRAFRMRPGDEALRAQMEHLATSAGRLAELVATYRQVAEGVEEDEVRLALYRTVARTCHVDLDWLDDAVDYFERVLRVLPEDHESVDALLSLYRALERWEDLLGVMGRKIDLLARAGQGGEVVELRFQMAELLQGPLGRRAEAVACYQTIREAQPESLDAVRGLKALYQQGGDWAGVAEATEAELGLLEAQGALGEAEELRLQLGTLYEDQLQAPDAAVSWYASLLGAEGGSRAPAVSALEGILALSEGDASRQERVATLLEPVYRKDENWERLSAALEIRLSAMEAVEARRGTLWELAALYEGRAEDQGRAFGALRRLLGVSSQDPQVWDELERVAGQVGQWGEVASLYDALTPELGESAQPWRYQLLRRQARIEEQELGRDVNARRAYEILLDQDPADKMAMGSLDEVYARLGAWPELVELLGRKIALEEEAAGRRSLRLRICDIYEERLEDPASAIDTYRAVLSELPGDGEALDQLERLLGQQGRWPELVELLTGRAEAAQGEGARRDIRYQLGAVLQHQLGELPRAVEVYRGLLGQEPVHGDALGAMEGLSVALEGSHDLGLRAAVDEALEPIYAGREDWARLGRILGLKLSYAEEVEAQIGLRVRLARLERDRLQRPEVAFAHLREAVALRCEDQGLRAELEALAGQTGGHMQVIGLYEQLLDEAVGGDAALRRALLERIAATHEAELVDVHSAINAWRRMLELDPTDLAALGSLERLHEEQRQWPELVEVCLQRAELVVGEAQVSALRKVGALYRDRLQDLGAAVETYDRIRGLIPGDAGALDALESLYEAREDWPALVQTLREKIAHCGDDEVKRAHHLRVARLLEEELRDPVGAIEVYHEVLALVRADAASLDALDRLYQEHERWEELSAILGRKQALCEEEEGRWCELRYRQGQVQQHQLFQVEEALETYRSVLARRAGHEETRSALVALLGEGAHRDAASRVLEPIYRQEARHEALVGLLELQLEEREEAQERLRILDDLARLHEVELVRPAAAFHAVRRAYLIDPAARARVSAMERLADQTDEHGALVMAYEEALPGIKDDAEALRVQLKVAATYRDQLQDALAAEDAFRKALERSPGSLEALEALEALMTAQARWIDLLEVLERKHAALSGQGGAAQEVLFAIARLHDETLDDPSSAIQTWLRVLEGEETNAEAIHALKALYRREGRWHDLTALLLREIGYAPEVSAAVRLRTELAGVYHRELLDLRQTVEVYRRILGDVPDHAETVASLEALFAQEEEVQRVAETLEPIYRRREDWGRLVPVLEVRLQAQEGAKARRGLMLQIARIQEEKLGALVEAMGAWRRVLEDDPREEAVWAQMERLAAAQGAWEALAEAYGEALLSGGRLDDGARRALLMRHAQVLDERLDRIEEAREVYREVLAFDEGDAVANDALDRILTRLEDWEELVSLYQRRAQLSEGSPQSLALLYKVATIFEEILQDPDRAVDAYQVILEEAPEEAEAARGLEKLYRQEARWRDLAELYRREAARAQDPAASIGRKHLLAGVLCVELGDLPEAVEIYREILTQDPGYRPSRDALEELLRRVDDPDLRVQVAVMLQPLYDEATEWERLIFALEVQLDVVQDPAARVSLFAEVARLRERWQADPLAAFEAYARAFHEDVRDEALRAQLERLAGAQGLWGRLVEIYLEAVDQHPELARAVALLHRAAQLYLDPMRDRDSAITAYCQVLELDSQDLPAILKLEELYRAAGLWRELVETLYKKADLSDDVLARKETLYRVAELWERALGDDQMAIDTWRQILDLDEEDLVAMEALERLYRRNADWENLITIFQVKVDLVDTQEEKIKVWQDVAEVYEVELQDTEEAINAYQTIRSLDADHASAIGALDRLYTREARWDDLLDILEIERQMAGEDVDARNAVEFRMGRLLEEHLMDPVRAIDFYRRIVERSPEHAPALEALELLISEPDTRMQAARVLEPLYERKGEWRKLVDALELKLEEILEPDLRRQALERMAVIHEERLRSQPLAFITYGRAFREAPEQPAAQEALERLAKVMGNWDELIAIYEEKLDDIYDFSLVKRLNLRLGQLHEEKLGDNGAAITRYQRVLDVEEYDPDALDALDRLFRAEQRWDLLGDVLERKIRQSDDPAARAELKFRLGYLQEVSFGQPDEAISHYKEILAAQPQHPGALEALERLVAAEDHRLEISDVLEPLYEAREDWAKLVGILEGRLALSEDPLESSALHQRVAALQEARLGDAPAAFQSWSQALRRTPEDPALGAQVSRLAARCGRWAEAAALYEEIADALYGPDRVEALLQAAGWRRAQLNQPREAEEVLRRVLAEDGENAAAMTALEELYTEAGDAEALYGLFDHKVHTLYDPAQRKALLQEMARLASQDLRDDERAIDAWRRLRESDDADLDALAALQALYARAARWEELLEVLDRRAELADDNAQRVALRLQMGEVARDQLGDPARAIDAFRYALDLSPGHAAALEALEALYEGAQEWMSLQEILVKRLQFADGDAAVIAHNRKLARLSEERFEDLDGALEGYRQILAIAPQHPEALAELERLYRKGERWYDLLEIYQQRLDATQEQGARLQLHVAISELAANQLHDMATAKSHLQEVLAADPNNVGALGVLGSLYLADGEWDKALEINARQIEHTADAAALSRLYLTRGQMVVDHFDDLAEATRCLREAVALDPHHREAADALKAHYERTGAWAALLELQRAEVARLDPAARVQPYLEMARVAREKLQDPDQAVLALEAAWEASGGQQEVAEELLQAYLDAGQTQKAEPILENLIETLTQKRRHKELFKFHHMRGQIALQRGDQAQAMTSFQAAYDLDATYIPNLLSLGRLYVAHERWDDALKVFQTLLLHQMKIKENEDKRDVYYFLGLVRRALGDDRRARDMFNRALGVDKDHAPSREALESL